MAKLSKTGKNRPKNRKTVKNIKNRQKYGNTSKKPSKISKNRKK